MNTSNVVMASLLSRDSEIALLLLNAVNAEVSAFSFTRSAALLCATKHVIPAGITITQHSDQIMLVYGKDLSSANVKSIFKDCLLLALASDAPISFARTRKVSGEIVKEEVHTTGNMVVAGRVENGEQIASPLSKDDTRAAAKALREDLGIARAPGGGKKGAQSGKKAEAIPMQIIATADGDLISADRLITLPTADDYIQADKEAFAAWLENVAHVMRTPESAKKVVARFRECGYKLTVLK